MLKILRYALSILTLLFTTYGLITKNFEFNHIMTLLLGLTMLMMGLEEIQKERKANGWLFILVFLFSLFVSVQGLSL
ncbi:DUF3953 domain-containing protein [Anoxybacteroides tepidamans]|uniref:DUF3953 domain-containing protein n=1 Tax=Anoxybacteroides tepidamans TaxID=265948 RepID=UPI0004845365|nr:DUF3953 domain-containing protein [Anoxybacillus tepidamans]